MLQLIGFLEIMSFVLENGYLPSPFLINKNDTLMDLFNTAYWANQGGVYEDWGSVYPPLVFSAISFISQLLANPDSWVAGSVAARNDSPLLQYAFVTLFVAVAFGVVSFSQWKRINVISRICIALIYALSIPALFALERGNLIIILPLFISASIAYRNRVVWGFLVSVCINLKPYMAILSLCAIAMRSLSGFFYVSFFSAILFFGFGQLIAEPYLMFFGNLIAFSGSEDVLAMKDILSLPSSIAAFSHLLLSYDMQDKSKIIYENAAWMGAVLDIFRISIILMGMGVLIINPRARGVEEMTFLTVCIITNLGLSVGGYSLILYYSIIPTVLIMSYRMFYIIVLSVLFAPIDLIPIYAAHDDMKKSFISDSDVYVDWFVSAGALIRPILNLIMLSVVSIDIFRHSRLRDR